MKKYFFFLFFSIFLVGYAHGFDTKGLQPVPPHGVFSVFSADSLESGKYAFGVVAEKSREPDFFRYTLQYAYGLSEKIELTLGLPYVSEWKDSKSGFEDFSAGIKHRFFDEGKFGPSIAYMVNAAAGSGKDDFSTHGRAGAGLIISKRVGPVSGHANVFYEKAGDGDLRDEISGGAGFDFAAAHNFKMLAELYIRKSHYSGDIDKVEGRFGYRFMTTDYLFTTIGAGFDFKNRDPEYRVLFSITALLPVKEKIIKKIYEEEKQ